MNVLGIIRIASEGGVDDNGELVTSHWLFPEKAEIIYGGLASIIVFTALYKFGWPLMKKGLEARTARIQKELDGAAADKAAAADEASKVRQAKGDINAERARILAEADAQAAAMLEEGRARVVAELADLEAKSMADIAAARGRTGDELRSEIARLSTAAVDHVVTGSLDDATHQELIENFIRRVGATSGANA